MKLVCVAPLATPAPVVNATLLSLFLFTRHGIRTPAMHSQEHSDSAEGWECGNRHLLPLHRSAIVNGVPTSFRFNSSDSHVFPPSCGEGSLLDDGFDQQEALGKLYREYLVGRILPEQYDPDLVHLRSSFVPRCVESAIGFMHGLYPPEEEGEVLNITTGTANDEPLCPFIQTSAPLMKKAMEWVKTEEFRSRFKMVREGATHNETLKAMAGQLMQGDYLNVLKCNNRPTPSVTDEMYAEAMKDMAFFEFGFAEYAKEDSYRPIWQLLLSEIDRYYSLEKQARFTLFSGHDITVATILAALGHTDEDAPPPFASHLAVEVWYTTRPHLRFVLNGQVQQVKGKDLVPLSEFRAMVEGSTESV